MTDEAGPGVKLRGALLQAAFALAGAAIIAFVFVPYFSPDTDRVNAFLAALAFMALTVAASHAVRR